MGDIVNGTLPHDKTKDRVSEDMFMRTFTRGFTVIVEGVFKLCGVNCCDQW
jgi:hypothetical protein